MRGPHARAPSLHHSPAVPLPNHNLPLASLSQQGAVSGHTSPEAFDWYAPAFVLLGLPLRHTEMASAPLAFTGRVRERYLFATSTLSSSRLISCHSEQWVKPVLFCAFLHVASLTLNCVRQANVEKSLLRPPPSRKIFLATLRCFSVHSSLTFFRERAGAGSSHTPSLPLHTRALLPTSSDTLIGPSAPASF